MSAIYDFIQVLKDLVNFFDDLSVIEQDKLDSILKNDIFHIEECMKKEQAQILKLRGLDRKREQLQEQLSFSDLSFKEIVPLLPNEHKEEIKSLFDKLQKSVILFKDISGNAKVSIEMNLYDIDKTLTELQQKTKSGIDNTYSSNGNIVPSQTKNITNRKI